MAQTRSKSARVRSARVTATTVSDADLRELARNKTSVRDFATAHSLRTKSEVGVDEAVKETGKEARRQAWAPPSTQTLSSTSSRFNHKPSFYLPPHPNASLQSPDSSLGDQTKPDDVLHIEHLERLREIFESTGQEGSGKLDAEMFMRACTRVLGNTKINEEQLRIAFKKIDNLSNGSIGWDDFCTFLYLEFHERDSAEARAKKVDFQLPAKITVGSPHHGTICAVRHLSDGGLVSCSEEGTLCFWSRNLELRRTKPSPQSEVEVRNNPKWISDMTLSLPHKKIVLTTGDCELQFFEMVNFEPYCQLNRLESIPIKIVCWHDPENDLKSVILVGDKDGAVMVMITDNILDAFKHWKLGPKLEGISTYSLQRLLTNDETGVRCYRWKLHSSWVTELHYFSKLSVFASCSLDPSSSLVLGSLIPSTEVSSMLRLTKQSSVAVTKTKGLLPARRMMICDYRVFRIAKGMSSADYCSRNNVIVTGSVDRLVRVWNPFMTTRPIGILEGHTAPVFFVRADSTNSRIYSVGNDNTIKVWDTVEFTCLKTVIPSVHKFLLPTQAAHFNDISQQVVLATDEVATVQVVLPLGVRQDMVQSHRNSISGVAYSVCFNHLITACRSGVVKVWDMSTGRKAFEFSVGSCGISSMEIDKSGKRIVTGCPNGQLKVWSYNSGQCLKTLNKGNSCEVTRTKFVSVNQNKYVVAVGWDQKVTVFADVMDTIQEMSEPLKVWSNATESVHKTDILTVAFGAPHLMATASFCGKIVVWSLVSYHILNQLKAVYPISSHHPFTLEGDEAVQDLIFLNQRAKSKLSASLVASGPAGYVHFWNIYDASKPMACFSASNSNCVTSLAVDSDNLLMLTGDIEGILSLWRIEDYCVNKSTTLPPKRTAMWRAHTQRITKLLLIEQWNVIISGSEDTSVRVWTFEGHYIGTFGQESTWNLGDPSSYQHPMKPRDLLLHTSSSFTPPPHDECSTKVEDDEDTPSPMAQEPPQQPPTVQVESSLSVTEVEEDDDLMQRHKIKLEVPSISTQDTTKTGKWLRHYRMQSKQSWTTSPQKVYRVLPYQTMDEVSEEKYSSMTFTSVRK